MWIFHYEYYFKGKLKFYEWTVTDEEFNGILQFANRPKPFRPLREWLDFLRPIWYRTLRSEGIPLVTFAAWTQTAVESYLGRIFAPWIGVEWRPEERMYRLQYTVMYYARERKRHTPDPFCECRAWCVVPETQVTDELKNRLKVEAWYLGVLFWSLYEAWKAGSMEEVKSSALLNSGSKEELKMRMIREGFEKREVEESFREVTRAVAFYKKNYNTWEEPYAKYTEEDISWMEDEMRPCILDKYNTFWDFKVRTASLIRKAAEVMQYDYLEALDYIDEAYKDAAECMGKNPWPGIKFGFFPGRI